MTTLSDSLSELTGDIQIGNFLITADGGIAVQYINKTGANTVKGTVVELSDTTDKAVKKVTADGNDPTGVIYEDGIADGSSGWVVFSGKAYVLLEDSTAATKDYWARVSLTTAGRADATNAAPPGGTVAALEIHLKEIGHCAEDVAAGTDKLALCNIHFL